jgi:hypothetical protein
MVPYTSKKIFFRQNYILNIFLKKYSFTKSLSHEFFSHPTDRGHQGLVDTEGSSLVRPPSGHRGREVSRLVLAGLQRRRPLWPLPG